MTSSADVEKGNAKSPHSPESGEERDGFEKGARARDSVFSIVWLSQCWCVPTIARFLFCAEFFHAVRKKALRSP